jgi:predicted DNA-binding transcriptional regulator AlpA
MNETTAEPLDRTPMWTVEELSAELHASPETLRSWRKRGTGPRAYKVGRPVLYAEADVRAWLQACELHATTRTKPRPDEGTGW